MAANSHTTWISRIAMFAIVANLIVAGGTVVLNQTGQRTATAIFDQAKGVYEGDDVQVLGVKVGTVTKIVPEPSRVRIEFNYDADRPIPAQAKAAIVAPSPIPVRNLTLTPVYRGGPQLSEGAVIPVTRTAVPVEWDELKNQLNDLTVALGPKGANSDGAVNRALDTAANNLTGRGSDINETVRALSDAMTTLADNRGQVFGTVRNLQVFVHALRTSDAQVDEFNTRLAEVANLLNSNSGELSGAIDGMRQAFGDVQGFLNDNRGLLKDTASDLQPLAKVLADSRQSIADVLHMTPTMLSNIGGMYDPVDGSTTGAVALSNLQAPAVLICSAIQNLGGGMPDCVSALGPLAKLAALPPLPAGVNPIERNGRSNQVVARPGPEPDAGTPQARPDLATMMTGGG